jgi:hypothetical protein
MTMPRAALPRGTEQRGRPARPSRRHGRGRPRRPGPSSRLRSDLLPAGAIDASLTAAGSVAYDTLVRSAFAETVHPGRLLSNPPDRMRLGQTERVEVRLAR